ncbi:MAG: DUF4215 domain-containing protein [Deltaproteobacteria bacterium]|nr:DUF4215 domain-containing protein [Deltaproteobacteria bacterium]
MQRKWIKKSGIGILALSVFALAPFSSSIAATFVVNNPNDVDDANPGDGHCQIDDVLDNCTLRAAITEANSNPDQDTIELAAETYTLNGAEMDDDVNHVGDLDITKDVIIQGQGARKSIISRTGEPSRIFEIHMAKVNLLNVSIQDGLAPNNLGVDGLGIYNQGGEVLVGNCELKNNVGSINSDGGAIYSDGGSITIQSTIISDNESDSGGLYINQSDLLIENTTISKNIASDNGGAAITLVNANAVVINSTIVENEQIALVNSDSGGIRLYNDPVSLTLKNSIVANNFNPSSPETADCVSYEVVLSGGNIIGINCGITDFTDADMLGTLESPIDPLLGALANNGGETDTYALLAGSPALGAGNTENCPATDQRGVSRAAACDSGAFQTFCGDGVVSAAEQCDDGNNTDKDGCSATCTIEENGSGNGDGDSSGGCELTASHVQKSGMFFLLALGLGLMISLRGKSKRKA